MLLEKTWAREDYQQDLNHLIHGKIKADTMKNGFYSYGTDKAPKEKSGLLLPKIDQGLEYKKEPFQVVTPSFKANPSVPEVPEEESKTAQISEILPVDSADDINI